MSTIIQIVVTLLIIFVLYYAITFVMVFLKKRKILIASIYQSLAEYLEKELEKFKQKDQGFPNYFAQKIYETSQEKKKMYMKMKRKEYFNLDLKSFKDKYEMIVSLLIKVPKPFFQQNAKEILQQVEKLKIK